MKKLFASLLALTVVTLTTMLSAQTADAVVEKYLAAMGGRDVLGKLTSRKSTGTVTLTTPAGNVSGPVEIYQKAPNKVRFAMSLDLTAVGGGMMTAEQRFDGTAGYSLNSLQGDSEIAGSQLESMRNNTFPTPLLRYKDAGVKIELLPAEKIDGKDVNVLLMTPKTGSPVRLFLDAQTNLVVRTMLKINVPQMGGEIEQTSEVSDYRTVDGTKVAFRVVNSNPVQTLTVALKTVEHNVAIDDAMFTKK